MKVLYISGMYPTPTFPQKGIFCHEQVKALRQLGVDVDVIVPMTVYDKEYSRDVWEYEGVPIRYLRYFKLPGTRGFENIGKHLYRALMHSGIDFRQYDVLHADAPLPAGDAARRLAEKYGIPFVVHGHGLDVFLEESYHDAKNCRKIVETGVRVYRAADAVIGVSRKVLTKIQKRVDVSETGYVVYNGVDTERFVPIAHENKEVQLISVGNLISLKGHDITIRAVKKLADEGYTDLHLQIAGRGEKEDELKALVRELGLESTVEFMGYVPYDEVVRAMQHADIFVLPSWYEALGCVYLEAMACGIPAVGCRDNGIDEVIRNGVDGYLVPGRDADALTECLKEMLRDKRYVRMGIAARENVEKQYRWSDSAKSLADIYYGLKR